MRDKRRQTGKRLRRRRYSLQDKVRYANKLRKRMTPAETALWVALRERQGKVGAAFKAQRVVCGYIPDFVEPDHMLIIEVDGQVHEHASQQRYDAIRQRHLEEAGYVVLRYRNAEVLQCASTVVDQIFEHLAY